MRLIRVPTIPNKYLDTFVHTFLSSIHALKARYDVAIYFIVGNSPMTWIPRLVGTQTVLNVDGLDWKREKWPSMAKRYLRLSEAIATKLPNLFLTDARTVQSYYLDRYGVSPPFIPYGSELERRPPGKYLSRYQLDPNRYVLFVGRLVPENCVHHLVEAFKKVRTDFKLVIVGGSSYAESYVEAIQASAISDPRIILTGYIFGEGYQELGSNAAVFVEPSMVGGTHPAVVEAMGFGNAVIVNDTPVNLETIGHAGLSYSGKDGAEALALVLQSLLDDPATIADYSRKAKAFASERYSWESVADSYEAICYALTETPLPDRLSYQREFLSDLGE
jgi:glycosyltransferase involved in cell wall biosynthesis